jgi:hypothetical protein
MPPRWRTAAVLFALLGTVAGLFLLVQRAPSAPTSRLEPGATALPPEPDRTEGLFAPQRLGRMVAANALEEPEAHNVAGSVVFEDESAAPDWKVHIVSTSDPFPPDSPLPEITLGEWKGRTLRTDAAGEFRVALPRAPRTGVFAARTVRHKAEDSQWVATPAMDLTFVLRRQPVSVLTVRVTDLENGLETGTARSGFGVAAREPGGFLIGSQTEGESVTFDVPASAEGKDVIVYLVREIGVLDGLHDLIFGPPDLIQEELHLLPEEHVEVELTVP